MKEIECIIDPDGTVHIDLIGFHGKGCGNIAEQITRALGVKVEQDKKCEYYEQEAKTKQTVRGF
jgi:hypothetical protein